MELEPEVELEIMEIVSSNLHGLVDELLGRPDWVEIRNPSATAELSLKDIYLGERFPADRNWYRFPEGRTLKPQESLVVYCDNKPGQGELHVPFELNAELGGQLVLASGDSLGPRTAYSLIQAVKYPPLPSDVAWASLRTGWGQAMPTPGEDNPRTSAQLGDVDRSGLLEITDCIAILRFLFFSEILECLEAADVDQNSQMEITDVIRLIRALFHGGGLPSETPVNCS